MKQLTLKPFQIDANKKLMNEFLHNWKKEGRHTITFQSPTGSGKTVMMAQFVRDLANDPRLSDADLSFLWASIGGSKEGDLASQSKKKFIQYYGGATEMDVTDLNSLDRDKYLKQNEILFFNWSKIKTRNADGRKLRRDSEQEITWDGMIQRTKEQNRPIVLIIDEAHTQSSTPLAEDEIDTIDPKIIIKITATHREEIDVKVPYADVVNAGLIKTSIDTQSKEDFEEKKEQDLDKYVLELALKTRKQVKEEYEKNGIDINPLLMIQLPNDEKNFQELQSKRELVEDYLNENDIDKSRIAVWLDKERKILDGNDLDVELLTKNNNEIDILLFKQAPATGWDCPRAQVLLMYRETRSPIFQVQLLGRVLRMPRGIRENNDVLDRAYLYTTYEKNDIIEQYDKEGINVLGPNEAKIYSAKRKKDIKPIEIETYVSQRTQYNDLGKNFQFSFLDVAKIKYKTNKELEKAGFFDKCQLSLDLVSDQTIQDYDNFIKRLRKEHEELLKEEMSNNDVEKLYKKLCIAILLKQEEDTKFGNVSRSWGKLKSALNVFIEETSKKDKYECYRCIVNDLLKKGNNGILLNLIHNALKEYKEERLKEEKESEKRKDEKHQIQIPLEMVEYGIGYKEYKFKKCAMDACYLNKNNKNEMSFAEYIDENENVEWWYKNGDNGSKHFSVKRDDGYLTYPDWFVKTSNNIWILETKKGDTAMGEGAKIRARAINYWLKQNKKFKGGLLKESSGLWKIAEDEKLNWKDFKLI